MSQALYRKYRPKSLSEVAGQEHITKTLATALKTNKISHAYLFTGPRGVGKTSIARILAHEINKIDYTDETAHIDIIEIDAASNRRIDEIRELREMVYMAPVSAKYKVYIIDEVHMLTKEAFNALLKTLEEPPAHVIFILATTDAHKLPETITSRTQRYSFKPISESQVIQYLKLVAKEEKIQIDDEALRLIAEHGQGSLRDSVSLLDQARSYSSGKVTLDNVTDLLGLPPRQKIELLIEYITSGASSNQLIECLHELYDSGYDSSLISREISNELRKKFINDQIANKQEILDLLSELLDTPVSYNPRIYLELALLKALPRQEIQPTSEEVKSAEVDIVIDKAELSEASYRPKIKLSLNTWPQVLNALKEKHNTLYSIVRMAQPSFSKDKITLTFEFEFHVKRLSEASNREMLASVIQQLSGTSIPIVLNHSVNKSGGQSVKKDDLNKVSAIFNGAELLES